MEKVGKVGETRRRIMLGRHGQLISGGGCVVDHFICCTDDWVSSETMRIVMIDVYSVPGIMEIGRLTAHWTRSNLLMTRSTRSDQSYGRPTFFPSSSH